MALYLNNLDLNGNQLQKAVVHPLSTAPSTAQEGQIYYDTGTNAVYVNTSTTANSPAWVSMAGDMTGITLTGGNGITATNTNSSGGAYSSTITLDISDSTLTTETAIAQADLLAFSDESVTNEPTKNITFSNLEDQIFSNINSASSDIAIAAGGAITIANSAVTLAKMQNISTGRLLGRVSANAGNVEELTAANVKNFLTISNVDNKSSATIRGEIVSANIPNNAADTTGNAATVTTNANLTGHVTSVGNTASLGSFTTAQLNAAISDGTINSQTLPTDFVSAASGGTFSGNVSFGDNNISNVGDIALDTITADGNHITIGNQASKTINLGKANTVTGGNPTDPSVETGVVVKGSLTVDGKLTVAGDFETTSTSNTIIKDKIIQLNSGATGANSADFGFVFNRGSEQNVAFRWDESELNFDLIATASSADSGTIDPYDPNSDGESQQGTTNWQNFRAAGITSLTGFSGPGGSITALNGSNISSGTVPAARVATLNQSTTGNAATATKISSITNSNIVQLAETQTLTNKTLTSPVLNTGVSGTAIKDEDDMTSNSATHLATQQSIKAYVDAQGSSSSNTGGRQAFELGHATSGVEGNTGSANGNNIFTITHGMGASRNYGVEVIRNGNNSGGGETVIVDVTRPSDTTIVITFASAVTALDYTALVCKY